MLYWNTEDDLTYKIFLYPHMSNESEMHNIVHFNTLEQKAFLVVIFDKPDFMEKSKIIIDGELFTNLAC